MKNSFSVILSSTQRQPSLPIDLTKKITREFAASTLSKWNFDIALDYDETTGLNGTITATSLEEMKCGPDKIIVYDATLGKFMGYGTSEEVGGE